MHKTTPTTLGERLARLHYWRTQLRDSLALRHHDVYQRIVRIPSVIAELRRCYFDLYATTRVVDSGHTYIAYPHVITCKGSY